MKRKKEEEKQAMAGRSSINIYTAETKRRTMCEGPLAG